ncbi:MAG TPA: phytanoyl-CoA dioxygenase family protein [Xanthobacteraceae bacterium]|nr:phytanoyl-CoA dioxygenase family protein [Xanthobacteraceae bacterium]
MISAAQLEFYRQNGYLVVNNVLDGGLLDLVRGQLRDILRGARHVTQHTAIYDLEPAHRPEAPRVRRIKTPHLHFPLFRDLTRHGGLIEILRVLLGPHVRLHGSKINIKAPRYGSAVEWHQDWAFYPHSNDDLLAVGIMLDDCTVDNGAMLVLPGSHRGPVCDHHANGAFCGAIDPTQTPLAFDEAVALTGTAGSMSFHHVRAVHGSAQNLSHSPRALLLYEFAAADAWPLAGVPDLAAFDARMVVGSPTIEPRLEKVPVRMPLPPAPRQGSIYENQTSATRRYFAQHEDVAV